MKLIVLEGIDGCGKSTVYHRLKEYCRTYKGKLNLDWFFSPEPSPYTTFGKMTREYLAGNKCPGSNELPKEAVLPLMMLSRFEMLSAMEQVTTPDDIIILDRYCLSTIVYQQDQYKLPTLVDLCFTVFPKAFGTVWIDTNPTICYDRMKTNRRHLDDYEKQEKLVLNRNRYVQLFRFAHSSRRVKTGVMIGVANGVKRMAGNMKRVQGDNLSKEELTESVLRAILKIIEEDGK